MSLRLILWTLQEPFVCKRIIAFWGYDEVVQYLYIEEPGGFLYFSGKVFISPAGFEITAGVVMCKDDGYRASFKCGDQDQPWVGYCSGESTGGSGVGPDHPAGLVQQQYLELFLKFQL